MELRAGEEAKCGVQRGACTQAHHHRSGLTPSRSLHGQNPLSHAIWLLLLPVLLWEQGWRDSGNLWTMEWSPPLSGFNLSLLYCYARLTAPSSLSLGSPHWSDSEGFGICGFQDNPVGDVDALPASALLLLGAPG